MSFFTDNFVDANGTSQNAHTPDSGGSYTIYGGNGQIQSNRLCSGPGAVASCYTSTAAPSADYTVTAVIEVLTVPGNCEAGVIGRMDPATSYYYLAQYKDSGAWNLYKAAPGFSLLGTFAFTPAVGTYTLDLVMVGSAVSLVVDGVTRVSATDTDVTLAGRVGTWNVNSTAGVGAHLESVVATAGSPPPPPAPPVGKSTSVLQAARRASNF